MVQEVGLPLENHYIVSDSTQYVILFSGGGSWDYLYKTIILCQMALSTSSYLVVEEVGLPLENHYIVSDSTQYII